MSKMLTMFSVKGCLATGGCIREVTGELSLNKESIRVNEGHFPTFFRIGKDCFPTKEEALLKAEALRNSKISSLRKQLDRLENLKFN